MQRNNDLEMADILADTGVNCEEDGEISFEIDDEDMRLDLAVSVNCEITRAAAARLIDEAYVKVVGKTKIKKSDKYKSGTVVTVNLPNVKSCNACPQDIPVEIVYEDDDIAVVNKPQGLVVHPAPGNPDGTLVNALMYHLDGRLSTINGVVRPGILHRIDKDTSGLLVVAKNDRAHLALAEQIKAHSFTRVYYAVVIGSFKDYSGRIDLPIGRHPVHRKKMAVTEKNSKNAVTNYNTLEVFNGYSLCEFRLETGRTHQIRVHASYLGHPIVGDPLYSPDSGKNKFGLSGQCLHAKKLGIVHPVSKEYMEFECELPQHFKKVLDILRETNK